MSTPTQRHTKSRKRIRRGAINLKKIALFKCPKCKKPIRPHIVCRECGFYRGQEVEKIRVPKALRRTKAKEDKKAAKQADKKAKKRTDKKTIKN